MSIPFIHFKLMTLSHTTVLCALSTDELFYPCRKIHWLEYRVTVTSNNTSDPPPTLFGVPRC
jgi:hypothetical protein